MRETAKAALKVAGAAVGIAATLGGLFLAAGAYGNRLTVAEAELIKQATALEAQEKVDDQQNDRIKEEEVHREHVERALIRLEATTTRVEAKVDAILLTPPPVAK